MTRFISVDALRRIVARTGVDQFLAGLATTMREDFRRWESFEKTSRIASHSDIGVIELMPVCDSELYAFKYVNGHPANANKGIPTVMAFGALAHVETGYPILLSELTLTTAFRTAAASVLAAEVLARPDSRVMGMIGCGAQSEFQAIAFHKLAGISEIRIFDVDANAIKKLSENLSRYPQLKVTAVQSSAECCAQC